MDVQLSELIEKIKTEGVSTAKTEAAAILKEAEERKAAILAEAENEAKQLRSAANEEAKRTEESGKAALKQAARDMILQVRASVQGIAETILNEKSTEALSGENLVSLLNAALAKWDGKEGELSLLLSEKDAASLGARLKAELAARFGEGMEIKPFPNIGAGFRIGTKDGGSYFDFSSREIAQMLSHLVNPQLAALVEEAAKEL